MAPAKSPLLLIFLALLAAALLAPHADDRAAEEANAVAGAWLVTKGWAPHRDFHSHYPPFPQLWAAPLVAASAGRPEAGARVALLVFVALALAALYRANRRSARPFSFGAFVLLLAVGHVLYAGHRFLPDAFLGLALLVAFHEFWRFDAAHPTTRRDWAVAAAAIAAAVGTSLAALYPIALLAVGFIVKEAVCSERGRRLARLVGMFNLLALPLALAAGALWALGAFDDLVAQAGAFQAHLARVDAPPEAWPRPLAPVAFLLLDLRDAALHFVRSLLLRNGGLECLLAWVNVGAVAAVLRAGAREQDESQANSLCHDGQTESLDQATQANSLCYSSPANSLCYFGWAAAFFYIIYVGLLLVLRTGGEHDAPYIVHTLWAAAWLARPFAARLAHDWRALRAGEPFAPLAHRDILRAALVISLVAFLGEAYFNSLADAPPSPAGERELARIVAGLTAPGDRILVLPDAPQLYYAADRLPAAPAVSYLPWLDRSGDLRRALIASLEAQRAKILVLHRFGAPVPLSLRVYPETLRLAIRRHYRPLALDLPQIYVRRASVHEVAHRWRQIQRAPVVSVPEENLAPVALAGRTPLTQAFTLGERVRHARLELLLSGPRQGGARVECTLGTTEPDGRRRILLRERFRVARADDPTGAMPRLRRELPLPDAGALESGRPYFVRLAAELDDPADRLYAWTAPRSDLPALGGAADLVASRTLCFRLTGVPDRRPSGGLPFVEQALARRAIPAGRLRQTVTATEPTTLAAVSLCLGGPGGATTDTTTAATTATTCLFHVFAESGRPLAVRSFAPPAGPLEWVTLAFAPVALEAGARVTLALDAVRPDGAPALAVWTAGGDVYEGGGLAFQKRALADDLCFRLYSQAPALGGPDLAVTAARFEPLAPATLAPGGAVHFGVRVENRGAAPAGPFWVEFFGVPEDLARPMDLIADSVWVAGLAPGAVWEQRVSRALHDAADGRYAIAVVADRPGAVADAGLENNLLELPVSTLRVAARRGLANLCLDGFRTMGLEARRGGALEFYGNVANLGAAPTGRFEIAFWSASDPIDSRDRFPICDPIVVESLGPGEVIDLTEHPRTLRGEMPTGCLAIGCTVDPRDEVLESSEAENTALNWPREIHP